MPPLCNHESLYDKVVEGIRSMLLTAQLTGLAQSPEKRAHIGILVVGSLAQRGHLEHALLQGLREQGYVEGKNLSSNVAMPMAASSERRNSRASWRR